MKFSDIEGNVNPELQSALHRAQDAVAERQDQVKGLGDLIAKTQAALDSDQAALSEAQTKSKSVGLGLGGDPEKIEKAMKASRTTISQLTAKVQQGQERLDDLKQGLGYANQELAELLTTRDKMRHRVLRGLSLAISVPQKFGEKQRLTEAESIPIMDMVLAYMVALEAGPGGNPFGGEVDHPARLFAFAARYFAVPKEEEFAEIRAKLDAMVWGDYPVPSKGGRGTVQRVPHKATGLPEVNWGASGLM